MKHKSVLCWISLWMLLFCLACDPVTRDARHLIRQGSLLLDTDPDSTLLLIDSVMRMEAKLSDRERVEMALLQGKALYGGSLCPDEGRSIPPMVVPLPELDDAAAYYSEKKEFEKAALMALYSGYSNLDAGDKAGAMQSFKEAEQYGNQIGNSLLVARSQYQMGKILYDGGIKDEALTLLCQADQAFGQHYAERAMTQNMMAAVHIMLSNYDTAQYCLDQAIHFAELGGCNEARRKALNNYAVLHRLLGNYDLAIEALRNDEALTDETRILRYYMNMGKIWFDCGQMDSAGYYYGMLESLLPESIINEETKVSAYHALSRFAEKSGDYQKALAYRYQYDKHLSLVNEQRVQNNVYTTEKRYDYERMRKVVDRNRIRNQYIVSALVALVMVLVLLVLFVYYRLIQKRLKEVETNALLLRIINQNTDLLKDNQEKKEENHQLTETLTSLLTKRLNAMQKLDVFMKDRKNSTSLTDLEKLVFDGDDHMKMMMQVIDVMYPGLYRKINDTYPELSELEKKVCLLSRFKLSRYEEAMILGISTSVLDKTRGKVKKITADRLDSDD